MSRIVASLSKGLLVLGMLMILFGLGWGLWVRVNAPPPPVITDAGAVVLAMTAPAMAPTMPPATATPGNTPLPTRQLPAKGPTPALLPDWTVTPGQPTLTPTNPPPATMVPGATPLLTATSLPQATPSPPAPSSPPEPTPSPTPVSGAQEPPTRVVAPAIDLDAAVVPMGWEMVDHDGTMVSEWIVPKKAAGWHINSALPGHGGNVVLSGHHNIEGKVFRYVVDLEPGDEVILYAGDTPYYYSVTEKYILKEAGMPLAVRQQNAQWIMPTEDERLTLVSCWPYEWPGNTHRVIVVARPEDLTTTVPGAR